MKQIDYLYEPIFIEESKPDFLEIELNLAMKYILLLEKLHDKKKMSMYEQFSLLRLIDWFKRMDQDRKKRLLDYVVPLMTDYEEPSLKQLQISGI